jgi:hypothetical protein
MSSWTRREFLAAGLAAPVAASIGVAAQQAVPRDRGRAVRRDGSSPSAPFDWRALGSRLGHVPDLRRRFIFEYYAWYETDPWVHWGENLRVPPGDIAASAMPSLGPYDSGDPRVIEEHARSIAEAGVGAINLSWWGRDSAIDRRVHRIMDVMHAHDVRVTFHLEPYTEDRASSYRRDVLYLLDEYGEKRAWDAFLLLDRPDGSVSPIFKSFATILPPLSTDCLGITRPVPGFMPDNAWRASLDGLRDDLRFDFDRVLLLCDSLDVARVAAAGFDGLGLYDPFVAPASWPMLAESFSARDLLFAFNVNVGFDKYPARGPQGPCFSPSTFEPPAGFIDWTSETGRDLARQAGARRFAETLQQSVLLQTAPGLRNARDGLFVTYINSFNEWHEGTAFEPARDYAALSAEERGIGYHNPTDGRWRLDLLTASLADLYAGAAHSPSRVAPASTAV